MSTNLLTKHPFAKRTKVPGLYRIGKDRWLIQYKVDFNGVVAGYQGYFDGSMEQAIAHWKDIRQQCKQRAFDKYKATVLVKLQELRIKLFK